ncbi:MAG: Mpo1-like protein [Planctomycetota bacterium]|jgi:uncharacterized membrane protein YGL010W
MEGPIANWLKRHRRPANLYLHVVGIPACFIAAPALLILAEYWLASVVFIAGYALQFIGHRLEGNSSGEVMLFRRLFARKK